MNRLEKRVNIKYKLHFEKRLPSAIKGNKLFYRVNETEKCHRGKKQFNMKIKDRIFYLLSKMEF